MRLFANVILVLALFLSACGKNYEMGSKGPAGGIVFFDKGKKTHGWRYLEAAPDSVEFDAIWSQLFFDVPGTLPEIGKGKSNTQLMIEELKKRDEERTAAQLCAELTLGKYNDWFLPSKDELNHLYLNLKLFGVGKFVDNWYWTSTQLENYDVWLLNFETGQMDQMFFKYHMYRVRPIRAF